MKIEIKDDRSFWTHEINNARDLYTQNLAIIEDFRKILLDEYADKWKNRNRWFIKEPDLSPPPPVDYGFDVIWTEQRNYFFKLNRLDGLKTKQKNKITFLDDFTTIISNRLAANNITLNDDEYFLITEPSVLTMEKIKKYVW